MAFLRGFVLHCLLIVLVVVLGFLAGVLAGYLWPGQPAQHAASVHQILAIERPPGVIR